MTTPAVPARNLVVRAVGIFCVGRLATLGCILGVGAYRGLPTAQTVGYWDGLWYIQAAKGGWPSVVPNMPPETAGQDTTAFFPGYPLTIRLIHLTGLGWTASAMVATLVAGVVASAVIAVLVHSFSTSRVALLTVALWAMQPSSYVLSVAFSEALFTALAAAALLAMVRHRWITAGLFGAGASATRSVAAALTVVAVVAALRAGRLRPWVAAAMSTLGVVAYFIFLRVRIGAWTAWFDVEQRGWHMHADPGVSVARNTVRALPKTLRFVGHPRQTVIPEAMTPIVLITALVLAVLLWRMRSVPIEVRLYGVAFCLLLLITGNSYASLPRLLVPAFPILLPVASWLSRRSGIAVTVVLTTSLAAACYLGVLWFDTIRLATHCCAP